MRLVYLPNYHALYGEEFAAAKGNLGLLFTKRTHIPVFAPMKTDPQRRDILYWYFML